METKNPSDDYIPLTPQAVRLGINYPTYVTREVFNDSVMWHFASSKQATDNDLRANELLTSFLVALDKKLSTTPDNVSFSGVPFTHFRYLPDKPKAKKKRPVKLTGELWINDNNRPWLLIRQ